MNRSVIIDFQARVGEARDILETANRREIDRLEASIDETEFQLDEMARRHSDLLIYVKNCSAKIEQLVNETMMGLIERERERLEEHNARLAELRETPAPKLIRSE